MVCGRALNDKQWHSHVKIMLHIFLFILSMSISVSEDSSEMTKLDLDFSGDTCCQRPQGSLFMVCTFTSLCRSDITGRDLCKDEFL